MAAVTPALDTKKADEKDEMEKENEKRDDDALACDGAFRKFTVPLRAWNRD
jgi:hypothetical protein